jgi:hypothetical protein
MTRRPSPRNWDFRAVAITVRAGHEASNKHIFAAMTGCAQLTPSVKGTPSAFATALEVGIIDVSQHLGEARRKHLYRRPGDTADWTAPGHIPVVERGQRPSVVRINVSVVSAR